MLGSGPGAVFEALDLHSFGNNGGVLLGISAKELIEVCAGLLQFGSIVGRARSRLLLYHIRRCGRHVAGIVERLLAGSSDCLTKGFWDVAKSSGIKDAGVRNPEILDHQLAI